MTTARKAKQRRMARVTAPLRLDPRIIFLTCKGDAAQPLAVGDEQDLLARAVDRVVVGGVSAPNEY